MMIDKPVPSLGRPATYVIKVPGHLDERWTEWDGRMKVTVVKDSGGAAVTLLTATVDQAGLQGLLRRLYSLGLPLISVNYIGLAPDSN
jgi:hypothetical protein